MHHPAADLAFSKLFEDAIIAGAVSITVFKTFLACDNNHERMLRWSDYTSLLLPTDRGVDVGTAIVDLSFLKTPAHAIPPRISLRLLDCHE